MRGEGLRMEDTRNERKERTGEVVSDKMDKTRIVVIERTFSHPLYGKTVRRSSRIKVHDEKNESHVGDKVRVMETRPMSKEKRWRLVDIIERAK